MSVKLPYSFDDITIEQYQGVYPVLKRLDSTTDPLEITDVWIDVLAYLSNKTQEHFENMPLDKLNELIVKAQFLVKPTEITQINETITVDNHFYKGLVDITKGNYAQYSSIKTILSKGDATPNLHLLLGCIYAPLNLYSKDYDMVEVGEKMKLAKVSQVLGLVFFYSKVFKSLTKVIQTYLVTVENSLAEQEPSLQKHMGGMQH